MPTTGTPHRLRAEALPQRRPDHHRVRSGERPGRDDPPHQPAGRPELGGHQRPLPHVLSGLRILVVDDDSDILELFTTALVACGGQVSTADNARDALALAMQLRPHVIVSDIAMVGEDGYWLIRRVRQLPAEMGPTVPVIAATAYGREHSRARVLAAGFTDHLQKPVDPEALCRLVARLAGR